MFLIEMCEFPIGIINGILAKFTFKGQSYRNKWERDDMIERAMNQIEKDMDVVNIVKVQQRLRTLERVLFNSKQRAIFSLSRFNYLSSESESSDTDPEEEKKVYEKAL